MLASAERVQRLRKAVRDDATAVLEMAPAVPPAARSFTKANGSGPSLAANAIGALLFPDKGREPCGPFAMLARLARARPANPASSYSLDDSMITGFTFFVDYTNSSIDPRCLDHSQTQPATRCYRRPGYNLFYTTEKNTTLSGDLTVNILK